MTREETLKIIKLLKTNYLNTFKDRDENELKVLVMTWHKIFEEDPFEQVFEAVISYIATDTKGFEPKAGMIKDMLVKLQTSDEMTEQEAWTLILKGIRNGIYGSEEEFNKLPPILQRLVGSPSQLRTWALLDSDEINTVIASNVMRSYRARAKHEKEMLAIPQSVKKALGIETLTNKMRLLNGDDQ